jgi:hypothetical protein
MKDQYLTVILKSAVAAVTWMLIQSTPDLYASLTRSGWIEMNVHRSRSIVEIDCLSKTTRKNCIRLAQNVAMDFDLEAIHFDSNKSGKIFAGTQENAQKVEDRIKQVARNFIATN